MNAKELKQEQTSSTWRANVFKHKKKVCAVCGSREHLEIHHVQAIANGGTNELDNLLVVCQMHHKHMHNKIYTKPCDSGRKSIINFKDTLPVLSRYFTKEIGQKECLTLLGYAPHNHSKMALLKQEYRKQFKVSKCFYNNIDLIASQPQRRETYAIHCQVKILDKVY